MKKLLLLFLLFFTTDSVASGIASNTNSAPCTNNTLETYSGNSNLSADWQPNEIELRWYNNNTLMDVQSAANTCTYDDTLTIPSTAPTRTGYTFAGWQVRPEMDFSTIPVNANGTERWGIGVLDGKDKCWIDTDTGAPWITACYNDNNFNELQRNEWKVKFEHGTLYGMAGCSADSGTLGQPGTPTMGYGQYCWCKVTGYKPNNTDVIKSPITNLPWVLGYNKSTAENCLYPCVAHCSFRAEFEAAYRRSMFGIIQ